MFIAKGRIHGENGSLGMIPGERIGRYQILQQHPRLIGIDRIADNCIPGSECIQEALSAGIEFPGRICLRGEAPDQSIPENKATINGSTAAGILHIILIVLILFNLPAFFPRLFQRIVTL